MTRQAHIERARAQLFPPEPSPAGPCFAVLDAARDGEIERLSTSFQLRFLYLLDGITEVELARTAPRVVELGPRPSTGFERLLSQGYGRSWGYYLRSRAPLLDVREQLASSLLAELPDGSVVRFRLFDPRVLRVYLPTCTAEELARVFGPIECFLLEHPAPPASGPVLECFARDAEGELCHSLEHLEAAPPKAPPPRRDPLQLRGAQVDALAARSRDDFHTRALAHLRRFFPSQCRQLGEAGTRDMLELGVARAGRHGFVTELEVCKYLNLMFSFGRDFDTQQIWARRALGGGQGDAMERLYSLAQVNEARALGRV